MQKNRASRHSILSVSPASVSIWNTDLISLPDVLIYMSYISLSDSRDQGAAPVCEPLFLH